MGWLRGLPSTEIKMKTPKFFSLHFVCSPSVKTFLLKNYGFHLDLSVTVLGKLKQAAVYPSKCPRTDKMALVPLTVLSSRAS